MLGADGYLYPCCWPQNAIYPIYGYNHDMRIEGELPVTFDGSKCVRCYFSNEISKKNQHKEDKHGISYGR